MSLNTDFVEQDCTSPSDADYTITPVINVEDEGQVGNPPAEDCANQVTINGRDVCL